MKLHHHPKRFQLRLVSIGDAIALLTPLVLLVGYCDRLHAQIIPDNSLGNEASVVTPNVEIKGLRADRIDGGAIRDSNLFHSFEQFNIGDLQRVYFANPAEITNIFSRVTGSNLSEILGTLGVNGNANLFFLNPNGIIFGENASLDIGGSFLGSTADSLLFPEGEFSAVDLDNPPLLTINAPIGLNLGDKPAPITNRSFAQNSTGTKFVGLEIPPGTNLTLVGGDINFEVGEVTALGGRVDLGGLAEAGTVTINENGSLSFPEGIARADVTFTNAAFVDVRGAGGGSITVNARNIELSGGEFGASSLLAGIAPDSGSSTAQAGDIILNATDTITVSQESPISNQVAPTGIGNAGGIDITTAKLSLTQGGRVSASTFGQGDAGAITIEASDTISVDGESQDGIPSGIFSAVLGVGNSGGIDITTANLSLTQGGEVNAGTAGEGDAGAITIEASDTISVDGEDRAGFSSGIFSAVQEVGNSGGINITTANLSLTQGGQVNTSTLRQGDAGTITIEALDTISAKGETLDGILSGIFSRVAQTGVGDSGGINLTTANLSLTQGGAVNASTFGEGDAGAITIEASGTIFGDGEGQAGFNSGIFSTVTESGVGNAGGININTNNLSLTNEAEISVQSEGQGNAGDLSIQANSIALENRASLLASTPVGTGGNITLQIADNLILRNNSTISAQAREDANGGNVNIAADLIVAIPQENSDITANAFAGEGGNIQIDTENIFGFEFQENPNLSDINASSQFGLDGTVNINTSGIEPGQESIELPIEIVDVSKLINQNLCSADQEGEFIITGKGGLSPSPKDTLNTDAGWEDWRITEDNQRNNQPATAPRKEVTPKNRDNFPTIIEAQGWYKAPNGNIVLTAQPTTVQSQDSWLYPFDCRLLRERE